MNARLQIVLFIIWFLVFCALFRTIKLKRADIKYILPWFCLNLILCLFTAFPKTLEWLSNVFGIEIPTNMLFFFGLIFLTIICFSMSLTISRLNKEIKILSQKVALSEFVKTSKQYDKKE